MVDAALYLQFNDCGGPEFSESAWLPGSASCMCIGGRAVQYSTQMMYLKPDLKSISLVSNSYTITYPTLDKRQDKLTGGLNSCCPSAASQQAEVHNFGCEGAILLWTPVMHNRPFVRSHIYQGRDGQMQSAQSLHGKIRKCKSQSRADLRNGRYGSRAK